MLDSARTFIILTNEAASEIYVEKSHRFLQRVVGIEGVVLRKVGEKFLDTENMPHHLDKKKPCIFVWIIFSEKDTWLGEEFHTFMEKVISDPIMVTAAFPGSATPKELRSRDYNLETVFAMYPELISCDDLTWVAKKGCNLPI
jgi:hypothetical protein